MRASSLFISRVRKFLNSGCTAESESLRRNDTDVAPECKQEVKRLKILVTRQRRWPKRFDRKES